MPVPWANLATAAGQARGRSQAWDREGDAARFAGATLVRESGILADLRRRAEEQEAQQRATREAADTARRFDLEDWLRNQRARKEEGLQRRAWEVEDRDLADARRPGPTPPRSLEDRLVEHEAKKQIDIAYERPEKPPSPSARKTEAELAEASARGAVAPRVGALPFGMGERRAEELVAYPTAQDESRARIGERRADERQAASDARTQAKDEARARAAADRDAQGFMAEKARAMRAGAKERQSPVRDRAALVQARATDEMRGIAMRRGLEQNPGDWSPEETTAVWKEALRLAEGLVAKDAPEAPGVARLRQLPPDRLEDLRFGIENNRPSAKLALDSLQITIDDWFEFMDSR